MSFAAVVSDLDAAGLLFGWNAYEKHHHVVLHNLPFGLLLTLLSGRWIGARPVPLLLVFGAFVSHLAGDYFGSGAGWGIMPFFPFASVNYVYAMVPRDVLLPGIIGNIGAAIILTVVAVRCGRTPLELVHRDSERFLVNTIQLLTRRTTCSSCGARALFRCSRCETPLCETHVEGAFSVRPRCTVCSA